MASRLKTWEDVVRHQEHCRQILERARSGDEDAFAIVKDTVDTIILRVFENGSPFWSQRPRSFDAEQIDKENVLANDNRVLDVYARALEVADAIAAERQNDQN